jgi:hypothetical protein
MIAPTPHILPVVCARTIRHIPVAATVTPNVALTDPIPSQSQSRSYSLPSQSPSQGSWNDHDSMYGPCHTHAYVSAYYWEPDSDDRAMHGFATFCIAEQAADGYAVKACVLAIQAYSDHCQRPSGGRPRLPPEPCKHALCCLPHPSS